MPIRSKAIFSAVIFVFFAFAAVSCATPPSQPLPPPATATPVPPTDTPTPETTATPSPTDAPLPTVDIEATVQARVVATIAARPEPTHTPTPIPTRKPRPTNTPKPLPTATLKPTLAPTATPIPPEPTYTPEPVIKVMESRTSYGTTKRTICSYGWKNSVTCGSSIELPDYGKWRINNGENYVSTRTQSKDRETSLDIRCRDDETDIILHFGRFIGFSDPQITYQIDLESPHSSEWNWSNTRESAFYPGDVFPFIMDLMDGEVLVIERAAYDDDDTPTHARFDIAKLSTSVAEVRHECGW